MSQRTRRASSASTDNNGDDGGASVATAEAPEREPRESRDGGGKNEGFHNLADLKEMSISKLTQIAKSMDVPVAPGTSILLAICVSLEIDISFRSARL